ncbi:MAG: hypothetical protein NC123_09735 [Butyrivibrio sp.]|nr:hypothetical protein [Acetatifactor muris]MCM1559815.1 hypothetical protein [Butyrivibrio sp.]
MKVLTLFKIIVKEFKKDILISIMLFVLVDFIYANFTGVQLDEKSSSILWQGGNDAYFWGFNTVLLKLLNVSIVFITVGKIVDKLSSDLMIYILARIPDYKKFIYAYSAVVIILGEILLTISHVVYYCFAGFYLEQIASSVFYLIMDDFGFLGIMTLYIILDDCYSRENSFTYIIAAYILNTILPIPILPAMSTVRFLVLRNRIGSASIVLLILVMDVILVIFYGVLIRKRRVNIC